MTLLSLNARGFERQYILNYMALKVIWWNVGKGVPLA